MPWYRSDRRIERPGQAVYLLQQSVEKAVKALMVADGIDEDELRRQPFGHDSLTTVLAFIEGILHIPAYANAVEPLLDTVSDDFESTGEIFECLENVKGQAKGHLAQELAIVGPDEVRWAVNWMRTSRIDSVRKARAVLPSRLYLKADPGADGGASFVDGLMRLLRPVLRSEPISDRRWMASGQSAAGFFASAAPQLLKRTRRDETQMFTIDRDPFVSKLVSQGWALPHLMVLAALTFPHATTSRYPAPVDAPEDLREAAKCGKMGNQHYTGALGVVDQIRELNEQTKIVLEDLRPFLRSTSMTREAAVGAEELHPDS